MGVRMTARRLLLITVLLAGCTVEGRVVDPSDKLTTCTDTRDGETFSYRTRDVSKVRIGFGTDSYIEVTDTAGKFRRLFQSEAAHWKCSTA